MTKAKHARKGFKGKQTFLHGALILTISMAVVKAVGALFKIPLAGVVGPNGMGYFNTAYTFYSVFFSLATAGFPVAIAKMVAENYSMENYNDVRQVKKAALPIFMVTGSIGTLIMLAGAYAYTTLYLGNPGAFLPTLFLAPSVLFCCLASIYRGYYEGLRNMYPTAISEIIESLSKLVFGLSGALVVVWFCNNEFESAGTVLGVAMDRNSAALTTCSYGAAAAILGVTIGSLLSYVYLMIYYKTRGDGISQEMYRSSPKPHSLRSTIKKLIWIAIPIAIGSVAANIAGIIDVSFLQQRLQGVVTDHLDVILNMYNGLIPQENLADPTTIPNFLYGCYSYGLTIFMLVPAITQAFGVSALPSLTDAWTRKNHQEIRTSVESILRITSLFAIPAGLGITALSGPISHLLYGTGGDSFITARVLIILGIGAVFSAMSGPVSSMLQAVGRVDLPVKFLIVSLIIKVAANYILCGIPEINIIGAGTGTLLCYMFVTIAEVIALRRITKIKMNYVSTFIKPLISALFCALAAYGVSVLFDYFGLSAKIACVAGIAVAVIVYVVLLLLTKTITKTDIIMLPKGEKIAKILEKRGWIG